MNKKITVLSCNLRSGKADIHVLPEIIIANSVDIVCAQELSVSLGQALADSLPYNNMFHDRIHRGNGIASRYPVTISRIPMPGRDGWVAQLSPDDWQSIQVPVEIANVHISGPHLWPYFPRLVRRKKQVEILLANRQERTDIPHAIFGDFNASPIWPVYKAMTRTYYDGMLQAGTRGQRRKGTWPYIPLLGIKGLLRIDHCFLHNISAQHARRVEIPGSDHLGIIIDLVFG